MSMGFDDILGVHTSDSCDDFSSQSSQSSRQTTPANYIPGTPSSSAESVDGTPIKQEPDIKPEQKPVKKRKSWGQQLPTPTTNLPPRKRAKTAEEKEQRRVERVLRNRAAAQKSREVKKQQLEAIEQERDLLKAQNEQLVAENNHFQSALQRIQEENRRLRLHSNQPEQHILDEGSTIEDFVFDANYGLDPTSLFSTSGPASSDGSVTTGSPCMTHQPAALMCDLPCLQGLTMVAFLTSLMGCIPIVATSMVSRTVTVVSHLRPNPLRLFRQSDSLTSFLSARKALP